MNQKHLGTVQYKAYLLNLTNKPSPLLSLSLSLSGENKNKKKKKNEWKKQPTNQANDESTQPTTLSWTHEYALFHELCQLFTWRRWQ